MLLYFSAKKLIFRVKLIIWDLINQNIPSKIMKHQRYILFALLSFVCYSSYSQVKPETLGGWYMYFWNTNIKKSNWGFQGDIQYRNWNVAGDLEQLLLRGGLCYSPKESSTKLTLGYAFILSDVFGLQQSKISQEHRIYQEALIKQSLGQRIHLNHRFRFEQRLVQYQKFRMRLRYNLFINIALNKAKMEKNTFYLALYNEIFINTAKDIGNGKSVEIFDRNRAYAALGYHILDQLKVQLGYMYQSNNLYGKGQLQLSVHHTF